jgi:hypothetical protein
VNFSHIPKFEILGCDRMSDRDAMEDIVDELGEDEITKESSKLFFLLRYLDKQ